MPKFEQRVRTKGHWFCSHCDDIVFMTYEKVTQADVPCPVCGHLACNFVPARITRATLGEHWFAAMRKAVDEASNPELYDQRHYKEFIR